MSIKQVIAFLGIGLMGAPMVSRLVGAGFSLQIWNRSPAKAEALASPQCKPCPSPEAAISGADTIITMLADGATVASVMTSPAVLDALAPGSLVIDMSSTHPDEAKALAATLAERQVRFIDAPVSGGTRGAAEGSLAIMAGGLPEVIDSALPVFAPMGRVVHVGPVGSGQVAKLCNQMIVGITIGAVAEALSLAANAGADPSAVRTALRGGFAESRILEVHGARMIERDFKPGGRADTQLKDMRNIVALAEQVGAPAPLSEQIAERYRTLVSQLGGGELDHSALLLELEARQSKG